MFRFVFMYMLKLPWNKIFFFFFEQLGVGALRKLRTLRIGSGVTVYIYIYIYIINCFLQNKKNGSFFLVAVQLILSSRKRGEMFMFLINFLEQIQTS